MFQSHFNPLFILLAIFLTPLFLSGTSESYTATCLKLGIWTVPKPRGWTIGKIGAYSNIDRFTIVQSRELWHRTKSKFETGCGLLKEKLLFNQEKEDEDCRKNRDESDRTLLGSRE